MRTAPKIPSNQKQRPQLGKNIPEIQTTNTHFPPMSTKIFVGGLHPATTKDDVISLIKKSLDISVRCFQLRTKYPTYVSFCVITSEEYGDIIMCSNIWPEGAKVMHFRGRHKNAPTGGPKSARTCEAGNSNEKKIQTTIESYFQAGTSSQRQLTTHANVTIRKNKNKMQNRAASDNQSEASNSVHLSEIESESESNTADQDTQIEANSGEEAGLTTNSV